MSMGLAQDVREHLLELEDWTSRHDTAAHSGSPQWDKKEGDPALMERVALAYVKTQVKLRSVKKEVNTE
jgi:hypothetical protein